MAASRGSSSRWVFTREQLESTPSRRCGVEPDRELSYRQQAAYLIQDMGQRLNVSQLTINTAIVYMHRFYMHHSFTKFHRNTISPTTLFLAAKVEEQPRKLEYVIKVAHACLNPQESPLDTKSNAYLQQAQELVILESIVLQTLASKDLAQTSYFMATNRLLSCPSFVALCTPLLPVMQGTLSVSNGPYLHWWLLGRSPTARGSPPAIKGSGTGACGLWRYRPQSQCGVLYKGPCVGTDGLNARCEV
ncbi:cyclin-T2-like isoform X2 [Phyllopteryx taeniolatus]|uniref:cyclin-T2-like isoform X2 n=1 Tax=Phyllopteryx taeniolatus TaxID=161469 RepID=UPI002AD453EA|nr:cyclin-T2-like isoform X2 [Phyllopteryx taeniolatus]